MVLIDYIGKKKGIHMLWQALVPNFIEQKKLINGFVLNRREFNVFKSLGDYVFGLARAVIVSHNDKYIYFFWGNIFDYLFILLANKKNIEKIYVHEISTSRRLNLIRIMILRARLRSGIVFSEELQSELRKARIRTDFMEHPRLYEDLEISTDLSRNLLEKDKKIFLFIGGLRRDKGIDRLVEFARYISSDELIVIAGRAEGGIDLNGFKKNSKFYVVDRYLSDEEYMSLIHISNVVLMPYYVVTASGVLNTIPLNKEIIASNLPYFIKRKSNFKNMYINDSW